MQISLTECNLVIATIECCKSSVLLNCVAKSSSSIRERVSPILVTLTSRSDSHFERSSSSFSENKADGVDLYCGVRKNIEKALYFSAD